MNPKQSHGLSYVRIVDNTMMKRKLMIYCIAGSGPSGALEIKSHPFFAGIDWELLAKKEIPAPFKPDIKHPLDTSNFSEEFTKLPVTDSPVKAPPNHERLFRGKLVVIFKKSFNFTKIPLCVQHIYSQDFRMLLQCT